MFVGHKNYRYFLCLLLYLCVFGIYINVLNFEFAYSILGGLNFQSALAMLLPWVAWLTGKLVVPLWVVVYVVIV